MGTKMIKCTCTNEYQDSKYGKGIRVANFAGKGRVAKGWRCTVCGVLHHLP